MIDTIIIWINIIEDLIQGPDYIKRLLNSVTVNQQGECMYSKTRFYKCKFHNFIIWIDGNNVTIKGSLSKYYQQNNFDFFGKDEVLLALKQLSFELGLNVERGYLRRIDVAENLFLSKSPDKYNEILLGTSTLRPMTEKNSKYFQKSSTTSVFYDKMKELKSKDEITYKRVTSNYPDCNVLRYEMRYLKKLNTIFKVEKVKVALFHSSTFFKKLAEGWLKEYLSIEKTNSTKEYPDIKTTAELKKLVMFNGMIEMGGKNALVQMVDDLKKTNSWTYKMANDVKVYFKKLSNEEYLVTELDLALELDEVINNSNIKKTIHK